MNIKKQPAGNGSAIIGLFDSQRRTDLMYRIYAGFFQNFNELGRKSPWFLRRLAPWFGPHFRVRRAAGGALLLLFLCTPAVFAFSAPLYSPTWGFQIDLPEGYEYIGGDGQNSFSFRNEEGAVFDLAVYNRANQTMKALVDDTNRRLNSRGDVSFFEYRDKLAVLIELYFPSPDGMADTNNRGSGRNSGPPLEGWGFCVELERAGAENAGGGGRTAANSPPLLLALAYGPAGQAGLAVLHLSALDSIAPSRAEQRFPGPVMTFGYPQGEQRKTRLAGLAVEALVGEHDAEAAQALVDREYTILRRYLFSPQWQEAWIRFYRAIYRDSWERLTDAAFQLERFWNVPEAGTGAAPPPAAREEENRVFAGNALSWVQSFVYERDLMGSDFVNLVSAAFEGRGDCDSRALLWAIILSQANIPSAIMVSRDYSHAMGLGDITGPGARFEAAGKKWLVAETTAPVSIGLIGQDVSDVESWLGVVFE